MEFHTGGGSRRKPNLFFALFMLGAGILLFLGNLGFLPIQNVWDYWPLVFVAVGIARLAGAPRPSSLIVGCILIALGVFYTLFNIGVLRLHPRDDSWPLSLIFLALGVAGLARAMDGGERGKAWGSLRDTFMPSAVDNTRSSAAAGSATVLENFALWSSVNRKVESTSLQSGSLTSVMGNIEIDLRRSYLAEGTSAVVDTNAVMGAIKLRIPEAWRVIWNGVQVMGNFEDKTFPQVTPASAPQLVLTGFVFMGSIEVES